MMYSSEDLIGKNAEHQSTNFWLKQIAVRLARIDEKLDLNMDSPRYPFHTVEGVR